LVLAVLGDVVVYVKLGLPGAGLHYLTPGIIFASILGAMFLGHFIQQCSSRQALYLLTAAAVVIAGCCASSVGVIMSDPVPTSPYSGVSTFLAAHHLYKGVGDYWTSAPITVYSGGAVTVRQVVPFYSGGLQPYLELSKTSWYTGTFQFLIYNLDESAYGVPQKYGDRILDSVDYPFSAVAQTYTYRSFVIVVWKRPLSIADLEFPVQQSALFSAIEGQALPGLPSSNWPKLSAVASDELPLFSAAGQTTSSHGLTGQYEVGIYNFLSASAETNFYENKDLALSYVIPPGAALLPLAGPTGVSGTSEGFDLIECGATSSVESGDTCSGSATRPYSAGVITVVERGSTVSVITYSPSGQPSTVPPPGELAENVTVAKSVNTLLASAGIN
jgi:hypothetical protein